MKADYEEAWRTRGTEEERWSAQHSESTALEKKKGEELNPFADEVVASKLLEWLKRCWARCRASSCLRASRRQEAARYALIAYAEELATAARRI